MAEQTLNSTESLTKEEALSNTINKEKGKLLTFISNRTPTIEDAEDMSSTSWCKVRRSKILQRGFTEWRETKLPIGIAK